MIRLEPSIGFKCWLSGKDEPLARISNEKPIDRQLTAANISHRHGREAIFRLIELERTCQSTERDANQQERIALEEELIRKFMEELMLIGAGHPHWRGKINRAKRRERNLLEKREKNS